MITLYIKWNINHEIVNLFGISIRYYGILFVGGLILCIFVLQWIFKQEGIPVKYLDKLQIYGIIGIMIGARLGHCLFYETDYYLKHPLEIFLPIQPAPEGGYQFSGYQGLASHGGVLGLFIAIIFYTLNTRQPIIKTLDLIAISAPLGACFIRLANLMNSEIIGTPSGLPWSFIFVRVDSIPRHPAQLYEAVSYILIFLLLFTLFRRKRAKMATGFPFGLCIALVFTTRFFIEFIKEKQVRFEEQLMLNMGQLLSIPFVLAGLVIIIFYINRGKRSD